MPQHTAQNIDAFFDFTHKNVDGSFTMYQCHDNAKDRLYILNRNVKKLAQFIVRNEPHKSDGLSYAQIKIIPYALRKAKVYTDQQNDPKSYRIKDLELTYHGGANESHNAKIHLKIISSSGNRYKTLVDNSLELDIALPRLVPLCSLFPGYEFHNPNTAKTKKNSHLFQVDSDHPIRLDFYLSGKNFDFNAYMNSMYSMNMFFSLDYLIKKENSPFQGMPIVQPITGYMMNNYYLWVKCSRSDYVGKPFIQLYNNIDYYTKVMNRRIAYPNSDGTVHFSTMLDKEREISEYFENAKPTKES